MNKKDVKMKKFENIATEIQNEVTVVNKNIHNFEDEIENMEIELVQKRLELERERGIKEGLGDALDILLEKLGYGVHETTEKEGSDCEKVIIDEQQPALTCSKCGNHPMACVCDLDEGDYETKKDVNNRTYPHK